MATVKHSLLTCGALLSIGGRRCLHRLHAHEAHPDAEEVLNKPLLKEGCQWMKGKWKGVQSALIDR